MSGRKSPLANADEVSPKLHFYHGRHRGMHSNYCDWFLNGHLHMGIALADPKIQKLQSVWGTKDRQEAVYRVFLVPVTKSWISHMMDLHVTVF